MGIRDKQAGLLGWILLFPIFMVILFVVFTVLNKAFWDYRVDQMCEVDGGDTVYKKMFFDREEYTKNTTPSGELIAPPVGSSLSVGRSVVSIHERTVFRRGFTELSRVETTIIRVSDKEVLAKSISYHRGGGNIPFVASPGHSCGGNLNIAPLLSRTVFLKEKTNDN